MVYTEPMIQIDGTDGGGQLLRTALSLSVITDTPFQIDAIRGNRPTPGLRPQHLTAVDLVAEICDADVEDAAIGADSLIFRPGSVRRSSLEAEIGTAGSVTLLFDTVLPITVTYDEPFELTATGGTDVKWSPTIDYHRLVKGPLLSTCGLDATIDLDTTGYYPAGGGQATLQTTPSSVSSLTLDSRGELDHVDVFSKAADVLADRSVADRQAKHAQKQLDAAGLSAEIQNIEYVTTRSPGSSLLLRGVYDHTLVGFDALGERGRLSETVADGAVQEFMAFHTGEAPVDAHMADQLLVFLALVGGRIRIPRVTAHVQTNLDCIAAFGSDIDLDRDSDGTLTVQASAHPALQ